MDKVVFGICFKSQYFGILIDRNKGIILSISNKMNKSTKVVVVGDRERKQKLSLVGLQDMRRGMKYGRILRNLY